MGLEDKLSGAVEQARKAISGKKAKTVDYLITRKLSDYFPEDLSPEEKDRRRSYLETAVSEEVDRYSDELGGVVRKGFSKGSMGLAIINDLSAYVSNVPIANVTGLGYALFAAKTIGELPAMRRYLQKSHDWYGAGMHYLMKPLNYFLPVIGGYLESGAFERMVSGHINREVKNRFIKEFGNYETDEQRIQENLKLPLREVVEYEKEPVEYRVAA